MWPTTDTGRVSLTPGTAVDVAGRHRLADAAARAPPGTGGLSGGCSRKIHWTRFVTIIQPLCVFIAPADLPDDPATLQAILRAALAEIERLQFQLAGLKRNRFGRRSEKLDDETLQRATEDLEQSVAEKMAALEATAKPLAAKTKPPRQWRTAEAQSRRLARASAPGRGHRRCRGQSLRLLRRFAASDRRRPG